MSGPTNQVALTRVTSDNTHVLDAVAEDVFDGELSPELVDAFVSAGSSLLVVAICEGSVVGQVQGNVQLHLDGGAQLYIDNLGVTGHLRRQGVGTALLTAIAQWGADLGCQQAWIVTEPENQAANALYRAMGAAAEPVMLYSFRTRTCSGTTDDRLADDTC